jgi:hypothetical protein
LRTCLLPALAVCLWRARIALAKWITARKRLSLGPTATTMLNINGLQ